MSLLPPPSFECPPPSSSSSSSSALYSTIQYLQPPTLTALIWILLLLLFALFYCSCWSKILPTELSIQIVLMEVNIGRVRTTTSEWAGEFNLLWDCNFSSHFTHRQPMSLAQLHLTPSQSLSVCITNNTELGTIIIPSGGPLHIYLRK